MSSQWRWTCEYQRLRGVQAMTEIGAGDDDELRTLRPREPEELTRSPPMSRMARQRRSPSVTLVPPSEKTNEDTNDCVKGKNKVTQDGNKGRGKDLRNQELDDSEASALGARELDTGSRNAG